MNSAFFYGSLMHPKVLTSVIKKSGTPGPSEGLPAILMGYRRHPVANADYPACVRGQIEDSVIGVLVHGLTDEHIRLLDYFEGEEYRRERATVMLGTEYDENARLVEADTYIWCGDTGALLQDRDWDWEYFKQTAITRFMKEYKGYY